MAIAAIIFAEQALRPEQQHHQRKNVGEPFLGRSGEDIIPEDFKNFFADTDDEPADDDAGDRGEPAQDQHRQGLEGDDDKAEADRPRTGPPHQPGDECHDPGNRPHDDPHPVQRNTDRQRRLMIVGDGTQGPADAGILEQQRQHDDHRGRHPRRRHVDPLQPDLAFE
jgi:hypothetical protein